MNRLRQPEQFVLLAGVGVVLLVLLALAGVVWRNQNAGNVPQVEGVTQGEQAANAGAATPDNAAAEGGAVGEAAPGSLTHIVVAGETLQAIANNFNVTIQEIVALNAISDPNRIAVGQRLTIPGAQTAPAEAMAAPAPATTLALQLIPDSELVYGPGAQDFSVDAFVPAASYLRRYSTTVEGQNLDGVQIVQLVAERTRVNPRLLLAALEFRAGWVMAGDVTPSDTPMQVYNGLTGLYSQLEWAANQMNLGYYGVMEGGRTSMALSDGTLLRYAPEINPGTAGVQTWLGAHGNANLAVWQREAAGDGFIATYRQMFGDPFDYTVDAFWPPQGEQPPLALPWPAGETWYFTGGPHGGWIAGSGWAALDFVPPGNQAGCYDSEAWLTAVADGVIARSGFGAVVLDLDGDGFAGTGWAVLYQHVATRDRVAAGTRVQRGDRIGHPSCEGGFSTGTHLHLARTYNGRWVSADGATPFDLAGWRSGGQGSEYDGTLTRNGIVKSALIARSTSNAITGE